MAITRRELIRALGGVGAAAVIPASARAAGRGEAAAGGMAVLYDSTRCIGCRECARACAEANGGDVEAAAADDPRLTPWTLTVLRRYEDGDRATFRKLQCMHCLHPACASGCMLGAMKKDADGAVTWNGDLCVGCRYCEIACPFNVPRFEWDNPQPALRKCELCPERRAQGLEPACVEACRRGALAYGPRDALLAEAHRRIDEHPGRYNPKVYGEHDGGGTSFLYLAPAEVAFADLGLPALETEPVPSLAETVQHTLYKGFVLPIALFAGLSAVVRRNTRRLHEETSAHEHARSEPVGGRLLTWPSAILAVLALVGFATIVWRFVAGLGPTTNLNDGYPFGLWITFDVVTGTALACGGYAVALLVYVANRGRYHPLVRAAIATSALGYTLGGLSVLIDIGRPWNFYKIPLFAWQWNMNSILLEVALCIMLYTCVLWIEFSPAVLERWRESRVAGLRRFALRVQPRLERAMPYLIALGLLLPTMHQSSLGSLMLLAGQKLHPLWRTPLLPLLFLISSVAIGYAAVTLESTISARVFKRPRETPMLRALAAPVSLVLFAYVAIRLVDVATRGGFEHVARLDRYSILFLIEMALFVAPMVALLLVRRAATDRTLAAIAVGVITAGALYRFSTYLIAYDPGDGWTYFPSLPEFAVTIGLVAAELLGYVVLVKKFPILRGAPEQAGRTPPHEPEGDVRKPRRGPVLEPGLATGIALLLAAAPLAAQETVRVDLRCLTQRPEHCLPEPVPADEPHGAECAVCHDLWSQPTLADAVKSCTASGCHGEARTITPFHRSLEAAVLRKCTVCHDPHDARIRGGSKDCLACHPAGGQPVSFAAATRAAEPAPIAGSDVTFRHETHGALACTACHRAGPAHRTVDVAGVGDCRSCHHTGRSGATCTDCHTEAEVRSIRRSVTRTVGIRVGSLDRPERNLPFEHAEHLGIGCQSCHTGLPDRSAAGVDCAACHEDYHKPDAECIACHEQPAPGAHDRSVHLRGCGGTGCHESAAASVRSAPRTRSVCLACHQTRAEHKPGRTCANCHVLPEPQPRRATGPDRR